MKPDDDKFFAAKEITYGLKPDWDMHHSFTDRLSAIRGPSMWLEVKNDRTQYGRDFDYMVLDGDCIMPTCNAMQQWLYYVLPEGLTAITGLDGYIGYVIPYGLEALKRAANRDGLIDEDEYMCNMEQEQQRGMV